MKHFYKCFCEVFGGTLDVTKHFVDTTNYKYTCHDPTWCYREFPSGTLLSTFVGVT
jgi:hypothetical protein